MTKRFQNEIERLKRQVLHLTAKVEESLQAAVRSVQELDVRLAQRVIDGDTEIDRLEVELEEECLKILALHQPVAIDLRFLVAALKINSDLERIGDLAVNIAQRTQRIAEVRVGPPPFDLSVMLNQTMAMVQTSADSLVRMDPELARRVLAADDEIDHCHRQAFKAVEERLNENPAASSYYINLLSISRNLERIGDHATNIAEDVIYMVNGDIVRHRAGGPTSSAK